VLTPGGKISRYLYGVAPEVKTLKMSLLEASNGKIGSVMDQILLFCFHFDPTKNKYTLYAWNLMQIGAALTLLALALILVPSWMRSRQTT
jgi:protein SCO1/2